MKLEIINNDARTRSVQQKCCKKKKNGGLVDYAGTGLAQGPKE